MPWFVGTASTGSRQTPVLRLVGCRAVPRYEPEKTPVSMILTTEPSRFLQSSHLIWTVLRR